MEAELRPEVRAAVEAEERPSVLESLRAALRPEAQAALDAELRPAVATALDAELRPKLRAALSAELRPAVKAELEAELRSSVRAELDATVRPDVEAELSAELRPKLKAALSAELRPEVWQSVEASVRPAVEESLTAELRPAVATSLDAELRPKLRAALSAELRPAVKAELEAELRPVLRESLEASLRTEVVAALRRDALPEAAAAARREAEAGVRESLRAELEPTIRAELEADVRARAAEAGRADAEARAMAEARAAAAEETAAAVERAREAAAARAKGEAEAAAAARLAAALREAEARSQEAVARARAEAEALAKREAEAVAEGLRAAVAEADARWRREAAARRRAHNWALELAGNVRVFARIRPVLDMERAGAGAAGARVALCAVSDEEVGMVEEAGVRPGKFTFDRVFGPGSTQQEVFDEVEPLVVSCLDGYNATVFAYGQTGSGKTFTIQGEPASPGVTSRTMQKLLEAARERAFAERRVYSLELSVLEVYNEDVRDLLALVPGDMADASGAWRADWLRAPASGAPAAAAAAAADAAPGASRLLFTAAPAPPKARLDVHRDPRTGGSSVAGLSRVALRSEADAEMAIRLAGERRAVGAHSMNERSSRSHLVITVYAQASPAGEAGSSRRLPGVASKLHIIDLAGSERLDKTGASGERMVEAKAINKSLSAFGNVMEALAASSADDSARSGRGGHPSGRARHVPFRDSKLTFLLQDSLRGGSKVLMFANVSPAVFNAKESTNSLRFAQRCRAVQFSKATKNIVP
ncbi:hypothetical protein FNF27_01943 [Cafeteria roenbergensis]|nr:hypothetical protein FNF27_01943 [Cafeteria roenbergensis]